MYKFIVNTSFMLFETFFFILPAFPPLLTVRLCLLGTYLISHILGIQRVYLRMKNKIFKYYK